MKAKSSARSILAVLIDFAIGENAWVQWMLLANLLDQLISDFAVPQIRRIAATVRSSIESALILCASRISGAG
jgi:uncharacterized protein YqcC (DUF446 family)